MDDETINVNLNDLTLGDLEDVEEAIGGEAMRHLMRGEPSIKAMRALAWVVKRQTDPGFSMDDAKKLRASVFVLDGGSVDPTGDAGSATSPPSA